MNTKPLLVAIILGISPLSIFANTNPVDVAALAIGYEKAFQQMGQFTVTILYDNGEFVETIPKIRKITAVGGALLIRDSRGKEQILDVCRVIKIVE